MEKSLFEIDSYFNSGTYTRYVLDYVDSLVDAILPLWESYESGLLFTTLTAIAPLTYPQGTPVELNISVTPGTLIATKMFKGIPEKYKIPASFDHNTPHMQHLLKAVDYGLMFTMLRWSSLYTMKNVKYKSNILLVGPWTPLSPGVTMSRMPSNELMFNDGTSNLSVSNEFYRKTSQFILDKSKFPSKTVFLLDFLRKFGEMLDKSVENWVNSRTVYGGQVVLVYAPGGTLPVPIVVAQRVKRGN